ncbi:hypothetical protein PA10_00122 [Pseudomonas phage pPa_SNUABM_DT01]|nr:hypothetical protein PA10_00122 [Pseudomonas phage pPa_SNUABM_DT01]
MKESTKNELKFFGRVAAMAAVSAVVGAVVGHCVRKALNG